MDPLAVFSEITCGKIFSYLSANDILNCSLINKRYYKFIGSSPDCMKKIKISFKSSRMYPEDIESINLIINSSRRYQNFESFDISFYRFNNAFASRQFKSIRMKRVYACDDNEQPEFFRNICATVEALVLDRYIDSQIGGDISTVCCSFPKLKLLHLNYIPHFIYKSLSACSNLIELKVTGRRDPVFYELLRKNHQLKKLAIVSSEIDNYFEEDLTKFIKFRLTYFEARDIYNLTTRCIENFKRFLESQMYSLEEIDLGDWISTDIVKMIFHMPKLKVLTFKGFHNVEEHVNMNEINFKTSQSIIKLNLIDTFSRMDIIQAFLSACRNVQHLKLYSLKENVLLFVSQTLPNLKTLAVDIMEIETLNNQCDFVQMTDFSMKICHSNLRLSDSQNNNFEKLVKKEVDNMEERNKVKFVI